MEEFHKYKKIYRVGHDEVKDIFSDPEDVIYLERKRDGGNTRVYVTKDNKLIFGSRTQQLTSDEGEDINVAKNFRLSLEFIRDKLKDKDLDLLKGKILYFETMVHHTINYDWERIPKAMCIDICDNDKYLNHEDKIKIFEYYELPYVGLITKCKVKDLPEINDDVIPICDYAPLDNLNMKEEGVVFKNYDKQLFAKYVSDSFKEKNSKMFGDTPKYNKVDDTHNAEFLFKYVTNPRIDKTIFKLLDEGNELHMSLMKFLPKQIYEDIWEEEWKEISASNWKLDLPKLRKTIPTRCRNVLNQIITNSALINKGEKNENE